MGSLESGVSFNKRDQPLLRSLSATSRNERHSFGQRFRSRFARLVLFKKIDYLQWICTVAVFLFFVVLFQMFLPGSVMESSGKFLDESDPISRDLAFLKENGILDFGEDVKLEPSKLMIKFQRENREGNASSSSRRGISYGYRKPKIALVFADLVVDPYQILMVTVAAALREIGYEIEVFSFEDGPVSSIWRNTGVPLNIMETSEKMNVTMDWLNYNGIFVNSPEAAGVFSHFLQEPFKSVPLIWIILERTLADRLRDYTASGQLDQINHWKKNFNRATVVVFPNYVLPMMYMSCDSGNFFVIPGSPVEAWDADNFVALHKNNQKFEMQQGHDNFVIVIAGSQFLYKGLWLEHALILQALLPLVNFPVDSNSNSTLEVIIVSGNSSSNYSVVVEAIAQHLGYPRGIVKHATLDEDADNMLRISDFVIYGSFFDERTFPDILMKAMSFGKPIIAPDLPIIKKYIDDRVNGYIFPKENTKVLTQIMLEAIPNGKLSLRVHNIASAGKHSAKNLMVRETVEGYAALLENVLKLPSEASPPKAVKGIPSKLKQEWQWSLFEIISHKALLNKTLRSNRHLDTVEKKWNQTDVGSLGALTATGTFFYEIWEEEKCIEMANRRKRREEEELKDRTDQPRGTWEEVYRSTKRADRSKNDLHERDDGELERTGQPLCIYEPYFGQGIWSFLHKTSLYRGLGLSTRGRRPGVDDIDAPARLPLLNDPYYRDILGEHGGFFAIANRVDRVHKNAWIGFQSWRATARKESLSKYAERALLDAIEGHKHGDTLYFWVRMDMDPRNPLKLDFWSFCDSINAGNCRVTFSETFKKMYGIKHDWNSLPSMPADADTWSVMHSWVLPTKSFLEFVMFSRMFVDSLDAQMYDEHHQTGHCYLSLAKDKHCYSRVLELLVNVWAYHSGRRMVYVNPRTGLMQEQHRLKSRRGHMWIKWFQYHTLKTMDEDLAEEADSDHPKRRWLWPSTGEVFWQGIYEKEKNQRNREKEKRKQQSKDKISRIRRRAHQKTLGKYVKPPPEGEISNSIVVEARLLR